MFDIKKYITAKEASDLTNQSNEKIDLIHIDIIYDKINKAILRGCYNCCIHNIYLNQSIIDHFKKQGYIIEKQTYSGLYFYFISWQDK